MVTQDWTQLDQAMAEFFDGAPVVVAPKLEEKTPVVEDKNIKKSTSKKK